MRNYLKEGTWIRLPGGECYKITGKPICEGGGSLIYPVAKQIYTADGNYRTSELKYALKECFPISAEYSIIRNPSGEIMPETVFAQSAAYLSTVQNMQLAEQEVTGKIYNTGFRLTPILNGSVGVEISLDNGNTFTFVNNAVTIMESLSDKGSSLKTYLSEQGRIPAAQAFRIIEQVLLAVREVHRTGFLHLDIQDGNVFIKGQLSENSDFASLIDFGSARKLSEDGLCEAIEDRVIFSTEGFAAPEITYKNDGTLRLGPEADIYSIGYLLLLLLTGQRYRPHELYENTDGHYLTRFKLRKINCPKHLTERMQDILAKALENEPEKRYRSCDEMLADVSDFAKALQPYRSDLSQVAYDAFICYKHGAIDSNAAKALQKHLEHFRLPNKKSAKAIRRIFVDEGELSACSDFGLQIREALKNAGWLIVICSPETRNSPWVNLEINTFLEYHDRSRILAVMTEGEPEDIFPDALLDDSKTATTVLAADARGKDLHSVLKKLKKDALLRIAAPILGTTYDSLKQRHRNYVVTRFAIAASIVMVFLAGFTAYTLRQAAEINKQYQQARRNQARYLSSVSSELLKSGDRNRALLTALAVEPEDDSDGAVVPEQLYALNNALTSYKAGNRIKYAPAYTGEADDISSGALSPGGHYYYAINQKGEAVVLSGENGKLLWTVTPSFIKKSIEDLYKYNSFENFNEIRLILPLSETRIAVGLQYCMAVIDVESQTILSDFPLEASIVSNSDAYDFSEELFVYANSRSFYVYDIYAGVELTSQDFNENSEQTMVKYTIEDVSIDKNNREIAAGLSYSYEDSNYHSLSADAEQRAAYMKASQDFFSQNPPMGLILYGISEQSVTSVSTVQTSRVLFADESHLAAIHFSAPVSGAESYDSWGNTNYTYYHSLYELPSGTQLHYGESATMLPISSAGFITGTLELNGENISALITWLRGKLEVINLNSGEVLTEITYQSNIIGASVFDGCRLFICLNDGNVHMLYLAPSVGRDNILSLTAQTTQYTYNAAADELILISDGKILFCSNESDSGMKQSPLSEFTSSDGTIERIDYAEIAGKSYRCLYIQDSSANLCEILIFPVGSTECIYHYKRMLDGSNICSIGFGSDQEDTCIAFIEETSEGSISFIKANITTGETEICEDVSSYDTLFFSSGITYSPDMNTMFVKRSSGLVKFDISGNSLIPDKQVILAQENDICEANMTRDGKYLVISIQDRDEYRLILYLYNVKTETVSKLNLSGDFSIDYFSGAVICGQTSSRICIYDGNRTIHIVDCETESIISAIYTTGSDKCEMSFFNEDRNLILADETNIYLYDISSGNVLHKYTNSISANAWNILTDSSTRYFALKDSSYSENILFETGISHQPLLIFYVDENSQFYPYASIDFGYASLSGEEISVNLYYGFAFAPFYDFQYLRNQAYKVLDGQTLTAEEKQEYFITD